MDALRLGGGEPGRTQASLLAWSRMALIQYSACQQRAADFDDYEDVTLTDATAADGGRGHAGRARRVRLDRPP